MKLSPCDFLTLIGVEDPQISPDARSILYVRARFNLEKNRTERAIWRIRNGIAQAFTQGIADRAPRWSTEGRQVAFLRGDPASANAACHPLQGYTTAAHCGGRRNFRLLRPAPRSRAHHAKTRAHRALWRKISGPSNRIRCSASCPCMKSIADEECDCLGIVNAFDIVKRLAYAVSSTAPNAGALMLEALALGEDVGASTAFCRRVWDDPYVIVTVYLV